MLYSAPHYGRQYGVITDGPRPRPRSGAPGPAEAGVGPLHTAGQRGRGPLARDAGGAARPLHQAVAPLALVHNLPPVLDLPATENA